MGYYIDDALLSSSGAIAVADLDSNHSSPAYLNSYLGVTEYGNSGIFRKISPENFALMSDRYSGDDTYLGSRNNASVEASFHGGNDLVELHSGIYNYINTNMGDDTINLYQDAGYDTGGWIFAGKGNDTVNIVGGWYGGSFGWVNGNNGSDKITNWAPISSTVRGGKDDDFLINAMGNMNAYGDKGRDTFTPYYGKDTTMWIQDYELGYDIFDSSAITISDQVISYDNDLGGLYIYSNGPEGSQLVAHLKGVYEYI